MVDFVNIVRLAKQKTKIIDGGYTTYQQPRMVGISTELKF